jgi:hypothetical protein
MFGKPKTRPGTKIYLEEINDHLDRLAELLESDGEQSRDPSGRARQGKELDLVRRIRQRLNQIQP